MGHHWRSRLNSSAAPLVLAKAASDVVSGRAVKEPGDWGCAELLALAKASRFSGKPTLLRRWVENALGVE